MEAEPCKQGKRRIQGWRCTQINLADYPFDSMLEIANIVILPQSSLCSQYTKSGLRRNPSRAEEDIWSSVASKLMMSSDQMKSADLAACRRLPMLGSFTPRYLCSHDNGSAIFHASIFGEGRMLFLRMGEGFALSGLEQPA